MQRLEGEKTLWGKREKELEKEKAGLHAKLEKTISALEERTSATIERATSKLQDKDAKVRVWVMWVGDVGGWVGDVDDGGE